MLCVQVQAKQVVIIKWRLTCRTTYLLPLESSWTILNLSIFAKGNLPLSTSHLPLGVTNGAEKLSRVSGVNRSYYKFYHYLAILGNNAKDNGVPNNCKVDLAKTR